MAFPRFAPGPAVRASPRSGCVRRRSAATRNEDVDWDAFDVEAYLADNYTTLHAADREIISQLSPFYRRLPRGSVQLSLELGAGPNLYPLMLAGGVSRSIEVVEHSAANVAHLRAVLRKGPSQSWQPFWQLCQELNPALPADLRHVLRRVHVRQGSAFELPRWRYGLGSMFFVAESVTSDPKEFAIMCGRFAESVVPGGHLVAAFMAGMFDYELGGELLPSYPVDDEKAIEEVFAPYTEELRVWRTPIDPNLPYRYEGMLLLHGRRLAKRRRFF